MKCCKNPFGACGKLLHYKIMLMYIIIFQDASYPVTTTYFPSGCFSMRFRTSSRILALLLPYGSTSSENRPTSLASWATGLLWHEQEIAASPGNAIGITWVSKSHDALQRICLNETIFIIESKPRQYLCRGSWGFFFVYIMFHFPGVYVWRNRFALSTVFWSKSKWE